MGIKAFSDVAVLRSGDLIHLQFTNADLQFSGLCPEGSRKL
jgi:hypothetical protein